MEAGANVVFLKDMPFMLMVGTDAWQREGKAQPVNISLQVEDVTTINDAAATDSVGKSLDYGKLYKDIQYNLSQADFFSDISYVASLARLSIQQPAVIMSGTIQFPKAAIRAEGGFEYSFRVGRLDESSIEDETFSIRGIKCACIVGVNPHERKKRQIVLVNAAFPSQRRASSVVDPAGAEQEASSAVRAFRQSQDIVDAVVELVEDSDYRTVEALANKICEQLMARSDLQEAEISVEKPYAIPHIGAAGVRIRRTRSFYAK